MLDCFDLILFYRDLQKINQRTVRFKAIIFDKFCGVEEAVKERV